MAVCDVYFNVRVNLLKYRGRYSPGSGRRVEGRGRRAEGGQKEKFFRPFGDALKLNVPRI